MVTLFLSLGHNRGKNLVKSTVNGRWVKSTVEDRGAAANNTTEFDITKAIIDAIVAKGIPGVKLVKVPEFLNLPERIDWINKNIPHVSEPFAMEFHLDSGVATAKGASVWFNDYNQYTEAEGRQFLAEYTNVTGLESRHVNSDKKNRLGDLGFVSEVKCASLLVELGFISNKAELDVIRNKGIAAVTSSIKKMLGI